ncbi:MAG: hypothetical protein M3274_08865 [Actinomycetota bacterium]|nr:hypothetical protein [Actinomycetota bacterium]
MARHPRRRAPEKEEIKARLLAAEAALERIDELAEEDWVYEDTVERMRGMYGYRRRRFATRHASATDKRVADFAADLDGDDEDYETRSAAFQRFRRELLEAEREAVLRLRSEGKIGDEVMRRSNATSTSKTHAWKFEGWRCATLPRRAT